MIVVDTNVLAYATIRYDERLSRLADEVSRVDPVWHAPSCWTVEYLNVLSSYMRFRQMPLDDARRLALEAERRIARRAIAVASDDVLRLVALSGRTAYDCQFVAAAHRLGTKLVTEDRDLVRAFPETAVTMEEFVGGRN